MAATDKSESTRFERTIGGSQLSWKHFVRKSDMLSLSALLKATQPVMDRLDAYWIVAICALDNDPSISASAVSRALAVSAAKMIEDLAQENSLDPNQLGMWCAELATAKTDQQHPLSGLFKPIAVEPTGNSRDAINSSSLDGAASRSGLVVDFSDLRNHSPIRNGVSFGLNPVTSGRYSSLAERSNHRRCT